MSEQSLAADFNEASLTILNVLSVCSAASQGGGVSPEDVIFTVLLDGVDSPDGEGEFDPAMGKLLTAASIAWVLLRDQTTRGTIDKIATNVVLSKAQDKQVVRNTLKLGKMTTEAIKSGRYPTAALKMLFETIATPEQPPQSPLPPTCWLWSGGICQTHRKEAPVHLCTVIGSVVISTVGPDPFETAVFRASVKTLEEVMEDVGISAVQDMFELKDDQSIERSASKTLGEAEVAHMAACRTWAEIEGREL